MAQLDSERSNRGSLQLLNPGTIAHSDCRGSTTIQSEGVAVIELSHQEKTDNYDLSQSAGNVPIPIGVYTRVATGGHHKIGSSNSNKMTSSCSSEGNTTSNGVDWRDKGAAVALREEYDVNGKLILKQVKKGVQDFIFGRILGEGSYSQVILGKDKQTSKEYAIKILDKRHIIKEKKVKYVNIEKDTLNRLIEHPGIIRLYYTFQDSSSLYYVLDVASGGELLGVLKRVGFFDEECTRFYGAQILTAIEHMHNRGVIHRDLKPENVLMDDQMHIKITDFGTAKLLPDPRITRHSSFGCDTSDNTEESLRAKSFVGTAEYVSPELLTEKSACKASDLWAFGCIIFQLLSGRPPFKAGNDYQTFQKIINLDFEYPPAFPPTARDLVDRLLVLDPQKRLTIEHIKAHPFFQGIQCGRNLWEQKAPRLKPYVPPPQEPNIIKLNSHRSNLCHVGNTGAQELPSPNSHIRPNPRIITQLPPPTQLDIEWSPVLTRNNERILKLGNLTIISSPLPVSPHARSSDHGDGHEKRRLSRFFGGTSTKKKQRLVMVTSSGRIILVPAGGEEKKLKMEISLLTSECFWRTQIDSKGQESWYVYSNGTYYVFEDTNASPVGESFRSSVQEWTETLECAKEIALSRSISGSRSNDTSLENISTISSSNDTLLDSGVHSSESMSFNYRSGKSHLSKNRSSLGIEDSENMGKKSRFIKRQSKSGFSIPF